MRGKSIRPQLADYLIEHPGTVESAKRIAETLGDTEERVKSGMYSLIKSETMPGIQVVVPNSAWKYAPPPSDAPTPAKPAPVSRETDSPRGPQEGVFYQIGVTKSGKPVLEDSNTGYLYVGHEI